MVETFQGTQVLLLSVVLITSCLSKLAIREPLAPREHDAAGHDAAGIAVTLRDNRPMTVGLAVAEGALGVALLVTSHPSVRVVTVLGFASATWVVGELRARRPEGGCGCFGSLSTSRVGFRGFVRAALFTGSAIVTLGVHYTGLDVLRAGLGWAGLVLAVEVTVFLALSPELGVLLDHCRRATVPCELRTGALSETLARLHASAAWRRHEAELTVSDPMDVWRELCWRLLAYPARVDGREVEVIFAVSMDERHPAVRSAVIDPAEAPDPARTARPSHLSGPTPDEDSGPSTFVTVPA